MSGLTVDMVVLGLVTGLSAFGLIALFLVLGTPRPVANGVGFVIGWVAVLTALVMTVAVFFGGSVRPSSTEDKAFTWTSLALGVGLILLAARMVSRGRRAKREGTVAAEPAWMSRIDGLDPRGAFVIGMLVPTYPPAIAAAVELAQSDDGAVGAAIVFLCCSSVFVAIPVAAMAVRPAEVSAVIERARSWLMARLTLVIAASLAVIGAVVVVNDLARLF